MARTSEQQRYFARRPMGYSGRELDRGQVFMPVGALNDERLERLGYMAPLDKAEPAYACASCGAEFTGEPERRGHGDKRHRAAPLNPFEEDRLAEREERFLEQAAPLYLDKTAAARA